ncbi:MAG: hypothetical protein R2876_04295 [Eubacteriales bacterium]
MKAFLRILNIIIAITLLIIICGCETEHTYKGYTFQLSQEEIYTEYQEEIYEELKDFSYKKRINSSDEVYEYLTDSWDKYYSYYNLDKEYKKDTVLRFQKDIEFLESVAKEDSDYEYKEADVKDAIYDMYHPIDRIPYLESLPYTVSSVNEVLPIKTVKQMGDFFYVIYKTEVRKFALVYHRAGYIIAMLNLNINPLDKREFERLEPGMSFDDVKKIDGSAMIYENSNYSDHYFDNGDVIRINYEEKDGKYYIEDVNIYMNSLLKEYMFFAGPDIIYHTRNS